LAGLIGAALAHVLTTLAQRGGLGVWLHGPFGPDFFNVALYTGVFYAGIGAAAARRPGAALAFAGTFFGIVVPMFVLTRYGGWGMAIGEAPTHQWQRVFVIVYVFSVWGTLSALGAFVVRERPWRGIAASVLGSFAGYAVLSAALKLFPRLTAAPWNPASFIPVPVNLLDGVLSGASLCLALSLERNFSRRTS
jgi:hypothetical protein